MPVIKHLSRGRGASAFHAPRLRAFCLALFATLLIALPAVAASADILYVKPTGDDTASGLSWDDAKKTVGAALAVAQPYDDVWVAAGTYTECITLPEHVGIYGGFAGTETSSLDRNWRTNMTVLDGDGLGPVVTVAENASTDTSLEGFVVRNGYADEGAGLYVHLASPSIRDCAFVGNRADSRGGGAYFSQSEAVIARCVFAENRADSSGGGVYSEASTVSFSACAFIRNVASAKGGGIFGELSPLLMSNCVVVENVSGVSGGGIGATGDETIFYNNIIAFNSTGVTIDGATDAHANCVYGNPGGDYFDSADLTGTDGNISADPKFATVAAGDLHLQPGSPCIDAGADSMVFEAKDVDGQARIQGAAVDMGVDESDGTTWPPVGRILYVAPTGDDAASGLVWGLAKQTVGAALAAALPGDEIWVAAGVYTGQVTLKPGVAVYGGFVGTEMLRSERDWRGNATILDGGGAGPVVAVPRGAGPSAVLDGVTVQNGGSQFGAGLYCEVAAPTIRRCTFTTNYAQFGSAMYLDKSSAVISLCTLRGNSAAVFGGGIYLIGGSVSLTGNVFSTNTAALAGGALFGENAIVRLVNNTLADNHSPTGGAVYLYSSRSLAANNAVAFNSSGFYLDGGVWDLHSNCVYGNADGNYISGDNADIDPTGTNGNLSADPLFIDLPGGDLHLPAHSPCIDAGDPAWVGDLAQDIDEQDRILESRLDIGADEVAMPTLTSLSLSPASVAAGAASTGTVTLTGAAPAGGLVVSLSSSDTNVAAVPVSVTITAGQSGATFTVTARAVASTAAATLTATLGDIGKTADLTVTPAPPTVSSFSPAFGNVGTEVTIAGTGFTGATAVTFNGSAATRFTVVSATQVKATVPSGATTGRIAVTTPYGTGTSGTDFSVVLLLARDIAQSVDGSTRLLITNGGAYAIVKWNGGMQIGPSYTPASGWSAVGIAAHSAGGTFILWRKGTASYQLWNMNATGTLSGALPVMSSGGWTATDVSAAGDGTARVLLVSPSGQVKVVRISGSTVTAGPTYTPAAGWSAVGIAAGTDTKTRLLWRNGTTSYQLWTLNAACTLETAHPARSTGGWTAREVSQSGDGSTRVLLQSASGQIRLHRLSGSTLQAGAVYTPASGWAVVGISADPGGSGNTRLLWQNGNGRLNLWTFQSGGALQSSSAIGTY